LAAGAWWRPRWFALLAVLAATMVAFAALDVREVFHQSDEARTGLEILASAIALLHLAAAAVAVRMAQLARAPAD
jgi:NO-binding membrane sensor protein with MHYT domain